ncbi:2-hydroxychromene-2-carboxylate isomerase [Caenispirillum bisanense]|uniref:2-hydroxychromene-2-carboxylate isomerase n=1 Tax=Caenispirillum bisanense TaxID=414052 RepID=A0A286GN70_9PROT|nr:2-hydroxychromene-2-carboxylate isomerase [Caenispirillum bisanense]SOD96434.1 2-hydroxychromene-2-carboxylate isomerase [Caenispirillum bisanense]
MTTKGPIEFYFDYSSPYGYVAATRIEDIGAAHGREVVWKPILLGVVFRATQSAPLTEVPLKGDYSKHDFARTCRYYNVPFKFPAKFPIASQAPARGHYWLWEQDPALAKRFSLAAFTAYFVDGRDVSAPEIAADVAAEQGVDRDAFLAAIAAPENKERLKAETEAALAKGVFGSPFMIVDGEPFWGSDRLPMLSAWLERGGW